MKNFKDALVGPRQDETSPAGAFGDVNVNADYESHSHRADGQQVAQIRQHVLAVVAPNLIRLLAQVTRVFARTEVTVQPQNANVVRVLDLDEHRLLGSYGCYRTTKSQGRSFGGTGTFCCNGARKTSLRQSGGLILRKFCSANSVGRMNHASDKSTFFPTSPRAPSHNRAGLLYARGMWDSHSGAVLRLGGRRWSRRNPGVAAHTREEVSFVFA
jgi:hypothetical protein